MAKFATNCTLGIDGKYVAPGEFIELDARSDETKRLLAEGRIRKPGQPAPRSEVSVKTVGKTEEAEGESTEPAADE